MKVNKFIADSAHDAYPFYELCEFWGVEPFIIDLNSKGKGNFKDLPSVSVNVRYSYLSQRLCYVFLWF
ncbi:MAG: hypothetical protein PWR06_142 [Thermoanaerobacteraceae bacterium]|nr:hypothetical protein [Thermoanaerobacteraceae bacterium]